MTRQQRVSMEDIEKADDPEESKKKVVTQQPKATAPITSPILSSSNHAPPKHALPTFPPGSLPPQGELRRSSSNKQLPSIPLHGSTSSMSSSRDPPSNSLIQQTYGPFFVEYTLQAEYNMVKQKKLPGVYTIPSKKCPHTWFGVVFIRQGLYQGGVFKFTLHIPMSYPDGDCPSIVFDFCVFHPSIHPETGKCDVKRAFPKWRKNVNHLWEVLMYSRRIFHKIEPKDALNTEAASLFGSDIDAYKSRVLLSLEESREQLYKEAISDDPHAIRFSRWDAEVHESAKKKFLAPKDNSSYGDGRKNAQTSGLSWMVKGSGQIFAKSETAALS